MPVLRRLFEWRVGFLYRRATHVPHGGFRVMPACAMHRETIVPHHQIAELPSMGVDCGRLCCPFRQFEQQVGTGLSSGYV
jgi:hypothetical protein